MENFLKVGNIDRGKSNIYVAKNPQEMPPAARACIEVADHHSRMRRGTEYKPKGLDISDVGLRICSGSCLHVFMFVLNITLLPTIIFYLVQSCKSKEPGAFSVEAIASSSVVNMTKADLGFKSIDETSRLLNQAVENGTRECHHIKTTRASIFGLPSPSHGGGIQLETDQVHEFTIVSYSENGSRRCNGGDFYETDLSGPRWKSRPFITDLGDGSYVVKLHVHSQFTGMYTFKAILLFNNLHGLDLKPDHWVLAQELISLRIQFTAPIHGVSTGLSNNLRSPRSCSKEDFNVRAWQGQWTRTKWNESCDADSKGRYRCMNVTDQCEAPWCDGPIAGLESNGWSYSAHCSFHLWTKEEAWDCLQGRWLYFWGDSNHQDTIRNLLNFILGMNNGILARTFDQSFANPTNTSQSLHITSIFNGHPQEFGDDMGLSSLDDPFYRQQVQRFFNKDGIPDVLVLNSGLHDGNRFAHLADFVDASKKASLFWESLYKNATTSGGLHPPPVVVFRTTVAPAGKSRRMPSNPHKMDVFNRILVEKMSEKLPIRVVDAFDMSFPWHYDNRYSDGGHYGRPPALSPWFGQQGHWYFVDVMLAHVLLNAICPFPH
ncbi:hypothetical protein O6H91_19G063100 [Diphasiastrum complanatum]|uniref:Uncharacterized protein n=1 Tax=Diphasiastrum complanatum TaxID=34168 RepID=A0ACC2AVX1_DIPCM|nr:hypothetical protein O6H91_19G063100 [Diphasiastrum complanatum]